MNRLKDTRVKAGLTQKQVIAQAGVSYRAYQDYEYGKRTPSVYTAIRIAKALQVNTGDMETLFGEEQERK
jgi:transcriptional regulator with XRE-family HTH domain